jgi:UDPglucose--hexose-1-phosphate uridylyltransferase
MPEIRLNPVTGDWVIIATERARRPEEFVKRRDHPMLPIHSASCPFCPGNEEMTPKETFRVADGNGDWLVRSMPNRFPALTPEGELVHRSEDGHAVVSGVGRHEVIVETPRHDLGAALLPVSQLERVLSAYQHRFRAFYQDRRIEHVILFKNHGEGAGTSLQHSHSQVVGMPVMPVQLRNRLEEALRHWSDHGECVYCRCLSEELREGVRVIAQNASFVAFVPHAALSPFHQWVFPKRHSAYFGAVSETELADLATLLAEVLARLHFGLDDPDYNFVIRSLSPADATVKHFHWYLSLIPRVSKAAGFELGTGMFINTALPEASAAFLRNVRVPV